MFKTFSFVNKKQKNCKLVKAE